jgi:hypothetical protein
MLFQWHTCSQFYSDSKIKDLTHIFGSDVSKEIGFGSALEAVNQIAHFCATDYLLHHAQHAPPLPAALVRWPEQRHHSTSLWSW